MIFIILLSPVMPIILKLNGSKLITDILNILNEYLVMFYFCFIKKNIKNPHFIY